MACMSSLLCRLAWPMPRRRFAHSWARYSPFLDHFVVVYLDDIVIHSQILEEHIEHLNRCSKFWGKMSCMWKGRNVHLLNMKFHSWGTSLVKGMWGWTWPKSEPSLNGNCLLKYQSWDRSLVGKLLYTIHSRLFGHHRVTHGYVEEREIVEIEAGDDWRTGVSAAQLCQDLWGRIWYLWFCY